MITCRIVLHGNLADLVRGRREVVRELPGPTSIKDAVEALGIPHVEIGLPSDLSARVTDGAVLHIHPAADQELAHPRFVCDLHLGKLVRLLRFCGFDTRWNHTWRESALARIAAREGRTVLSRHRALLKRSAVTSGMLIRSDHADAQFGEVLRRFQLAARVTRPGRCAACNGLLVATAKADVPVAIPPRTAAWRDQYWLCAGCGQLFWDGTHVERLRARVARAIATAGNDAP